MTAWLPLCLALGALHWICLLLDEILFPRYRKVRVASPVFIVGPPRGGTTFLHRVLARDANRFATFTLGEMVFMPSILERRIAAVLARLDRGLGNPVQRWMKRFEKRFFEPYAYMHKVSIFEPEEDFVLLGYVLANHLFLTVFPFLDLYGELWRFDTAVPRRRQDRIVRFYRRCIQRHLYVHGPEKCHLAKNPFFTSMIEALQREFPDAKFICNVRHPVENIPSFLSIWKTLYQGIGNDPNHYLAQEFILDWLRDTYLYGGEQVAALPPERGAIVKYQPLVTQPRETVLDLYETFCFTPDPSFRTALDDEAERARSYASSHRYDPADFELTKAEIRSRFDKVIQRYDFAAEDASIPPVDRRPAKD